MLNLSFNIAQNLADGTTFDFVDTTNNYGVGGNPAYSDILATRLYFGVYSAQIDPKILNYNASMDEYREYQKTSTTVSSYDSKSILVNELFIPYVSGLTVLYNDQFVTTGRYCKPHSFLPTINKIPLTLTTTDLGITPSVFPDGVYYLSYEVYVTSGISTGGNVAANTQYMVSGSGTVTYNGNVYRTGEVFIAADNNAVTYTSSAVLVTLSAITFKYFTLSYNIESQLSVMILTLVQDCTCNDEIWYQISNMRNDLDAVKMADTMNKTDAELSNQIINNIQTTITTIYNSKQI